MVVAPPTSKSKVPSFQPGGRFVSESVCRIRGWTGWVAVDCRWHTWYRLSLGAARPQQMLFFFENMFWVFELWSRKWKGAVRKGRPEAQKLLFGFSLLADGSKIFQLCIKTLQLLSSAPSYWPSYPTGTRQWIIFFFRICFLQCVSFKGLISNTCQSNILWPELMLRTNRPHRPSWPNLIWNLSCWTSYSHKSCTFFSFLCLLFSLRRSIESCAPFSPGLPLDYKFPRFSPDKPCTSGYYPRPPDSLLKRCESLP